MIKLAGLAVREYFQPEQGNHVWQRNASILELVRVRVFPGTRAPSEVCERHIQLKSDPRASERWDALLPLVRKIRFDPPASARPPAPLDLEDYSVGLSERWRARELSDVLHPLWLLRATALPEGTP